MRWFKFRHKKAKKEVELTKEVKPKAVTSEHTHKVYNNSK